MPKKTITPQQYEEIKETYQDAVQARNEEIRRLFREEGKTMTEIARIYGIDLGLVSKIIAGKR